jgi:hypothetical protein
MLVFARSDLDNLCCVCVSKEPRQWPIATHMVIEHHGAVALGVSPLPVDKLPVNGVTPRCSRRSVFQSARARPTHTV